MPEIEGDIQSLRGKIILDAIAQYDKELDSALSSAKDVVGKTYEQLSRELSSRKREIELKAEAEERRALSMATAETRDKLLRVREEARDKLRSVVLEKIRALQSSQAYRRFIHRCLAEGAEIIGSKSIDIYCRKVDAGIVKASARELDIEATLHEKDLIGGIQISSKDERVTVDYSLDSMLDDIFRNDRQMVDRLLFGE
ncbi:MAG: V-type ATP synthase subunit E [Thermoprotei archaeon]